LELTESLEREQTMNDMKSYFISVASHEFRTPLSVIMSSMSLIEAYNKDEQEEKRNKHIGRIKTTVRSLVGILDDFLSLEKLEQGKEEIKRETFDLYHFSGEIVEDLKSLLKPGQRIDFSHAGEKEIVQDKKILKNVLLNLLSNAIKYSEENKEIKFVVEVSRNLVSIQVKDNGIGIPEKEQEKLFSKFFRATNAVNIQGTGLGLNIVKKYVELLGGIISFVSRPGEGTTFSIAFPQSNN
jgi:signal transduction histidine kinase